ncbi:MAG: DinB family protein [Acidobacteria bacterium]|nr:DinB family protein [Acidobacteriota bacterium]
MSPDVRRLLAVIDAAYNRRSWHGTNLRGSIRGLTARQAAWRPSPRRHNIWELVVHAAYWKYAALRRLTGARRGSLPLTGSNWFARGGVADERAWREDVALLDRMHRSLRDAVAKLSPADLRRPRAGSTVSAFALLSGIAAHDVYHAGQIQLLKCLQRRS